jgi:hypothetical protein
MESIYWTNPFAWALRAIVLSEWTAGAYAAKVPVRDFVTGAATPGATQTLGQFYAANFTLQWGEAWQWGAIGFLLGYAVLLGCCCGPLALRHCR